MKRAMVAGGAGFIGSHLCEKLLKGGWQVACVDNYCTSKPANVKDLQGKPGFSLVEQDITQALDKGVAKGGLDVIFNLASPASPIDYQKLPIQTLRAGSAGTYNLLELARELKCRFVQASTSEVYGDPLVHPQKEDYWGNVNPVGPRSCYDESKRFGESLCMAFHRVHGLDVRIARIFNTYGPRMRLDDGRVVPNLVSQAFTGNPLTIYGNGSQTRSFCYVSDMVEGLVLLAEKQGLGGQVVNLGNPTEFTILQFAKKVVAATCSKSIIEFSPLPADDPKRRNPDISKARRLLGWEPKVPLEEGLSTTCMYFRNR